MPARNRTTCTKSLKWPAWKGSVLAIIVEAQQLLVFGVIPGVIELVENCERRDGRRGTAPLAAQFGELCTFVGLRVEEDTARGIKEQGCLHEPPPPLLRFRFRAIAKLVKEKFDWEKGFLFGVRHPAVLRDPHPRVWQILKVFNWIPDILPDNQVAIRCLVLLRAVPEFARLETMVNTGHAEEGVTARAAEHIGKNRLLLCFVLLIDPGL